MLMRAKKTGKPKRNTLDIRVPQVTDRKGNVRRKAYTYKRKC